MKKNVVYGYARTSTLKQRLERQIENIKAEYPEAVIICEKYSGTTLDRPAWNNLRKILKAGDTVVFDEVSRMSRNALEGFQMYEELYNEGISLVFLKERHLDTDVYRKTLENGIDMTGTDVDCILQGINDYLLILAKKQIEIAFQTAQREIDFLHQRTSEGVRRAQAAGKQVGRMDGARISVRKAAPIKELIRQYSKDFDGILNDNEVMAILKSKTITITITGQTGQKMTREQPAGVARNTYYRYKSELRKAQQESPS